LFAGRKLLKNLKVIIGTDVELGLLIKRYPKYRSLPVRMFYHNGMKRFRYFRDAALKEFSDAGGQGQ
jgi:hypothetical protein